MGNALADSVAGDNHLLVRYGVSIDVTFYFSPARTVDVYHNGIPTGTLSDLPLLTRFRCIWFTQATPDIHFFNALTTKQPIQTASVQ